MVVTVVVVAIVVVGGPTGAMVTDDVTGPCGRLGGSWDLAPYSTYCGREKKFHN